MIDERHADIHKLFASSENNGEITLQCIYTYTRVVGNLPICESSKRQHWT